MNNSKKHNNKKARPKKDPRKVFVAYGRNLAARDALFKFLHSIDLRPLEWNEIITMTGGGTPHISEILTAGFAAAQAFIILITPDDQAQLHPHFQNPDEALYETQVTAQARPNVLFEAGMAMERKPKRTIIVELGDTRPFSDISGRHTLKMNDSAEMRCALINRLKAAGCKVNQKGTDWLSAGKFDKALTDIANHTHFHPHAIQDLANYCSIQAKWGEDHMHSIINQAKHEVWISGIALDRVTHITDTDLFAAKIREGCEFRFLTIHPKIATKVETYLNETPGGLDGKLKTSLIKLHRWAQNYPDQVKIKTITHRPAIGYFIADPKHNGGCMAISPYLYKTSGVNSPIFLLTKRNNPTWFDTFRDRFNQLWEDGKRWKGQN